MIVPVLKFSDIKKDPNTLLGVNHAYVCKYGDVVAHVVSPDRIAELLEIERMHSDAKSAWLNSKEYLDLAIKHMSDCDERNLIINAHNSMSELFFEDED